MITVTVAKISLGKSSNAVSKFIALAPCRSICQMLVNFFELNS